MEFISREISSWVCLAFGIRSSFALERESIFVACVEIKEHRLREFLNPSSMCEKTYPYLYGPTSSTEIVFTQSGEHWEMMY